MSGEQLHFRTSDGRIAIHNGLFPQLTLEFDNIVNEVRKKNLKKRLSKNITNKVYTALIEFYMSQFDSFENTPNYVEIDGQTYTKREYFRNKFPSEFIAMKSGDNLLEGLSFFNTLEVTNNRITFTNAGKLTVEDVNTFKDQWESLLYTGVDDYYDLAIKLAQYTFFSNGFGFGKNTFAHLIPTEVKIQIPEYVDKLYDIFS